jgi:hypothetical protein
VTEEIGNGMGWVITCKSAAEARTALADALRVLEQLGVHLNLEKTRIVHLRFGFEFLGSYAKIESAREMK